MLGQKFSADHILKYLTYFFQKIWFWHFMQIVSCGDNLYEMSKPIFWEKINMKILSICCLPNVSKGDRHNLQACKWNQDICWIFISSRTRIRMHWIDILLYPTHSPKDVHDDLVLYVPFNNISHIETTTLTRLYIWLLSFFESYGEKSKSMQ